MNILIGGAWPYANGSLHIGHIAALLPGDILARYYRLKGEKVCYVSGSDCHGTPVAIRANKENQSPFKISDKYHYEFVEAFKYLGFSYDYYGKTSSEGHKDFVKEFHKRLYESNYIYEKEVPQTYCKTCNKFLADRFVIGTCPVCGKNARGDQCDHCGSVFQPEELLDVKCNECGNKPIFVESKHVYLAITQLESQLQKLVDNSEGWRKNAIAFTNRYINEGLRDRAITRDLEWGIDVPKEGYSDKKIYIWAENVLGYLSSCYLYFNEDISVFNTFWNKDSKHYYIHGKDNIPFHTIILPALLIASGNKYKLPDTIISSEHLTLEGRKISTSENWAIWVKDLMFKYNPDAIRYFLVSNGPEKRDTDFSWREFVNCNNGELLGAYGNFVNRTLVFIKKSFEYKVPEGRLDELLSEKIKQLYQVTGEKIVVGDFKEGLEEIFTFIRSANKYFDERKPWITVKTDLENCQDTLFNCVHIIANLAILLHPFLPFSSSKIIKWFSLIEEWKEQYIQKGYIIPKPEILFERLDKKIVEEELKKMNEYN